MTTEQPSPKPDKQELTEVDPELLTTLTDADKILAGDFSLEADFSGALVDFNQTTLSPADRAFAQAWLQRHLGANPSQAPIKETLISRDSRTILEVLDIIFGADEQRWYFSRLHEALTDQNEQPIVDRLEREWYVLWPDFMYDMQIEQGYQSIG